MPSVKVFSLVLVLLFINSINAENNRRKYRKGRNSEQVSEKLNDFIKNEKNLMFETKWRTNVWESIVDQKNNKSFTRSFFNNGSIVSRIMNENEIMDRESMKEVMKKKKNKKIRSQPKRKSHQNYRKSSRNSNMNNENVFNNEFEGKPKIIISLERSKRQAANSGSSGSDGNIFRELLFIIISFVLLLRSTDRYI